MCACAPGPPGGRAGLDPVLLLEYLGQRALHRLPVLQLQGENLLLCRPSRQVAHPVLPGVLGVGDLDLQVPQLLAQPRPLVVVESERVQGVPQVQQLAHEVRDRLGLVERRRRHVDVESQLPMAGPHGPKIPSEISNSLKKTKIFPYVKGRTLQKYFHEWIKTTKIVSMNG